jgi:thioesterase domain-containing protein
VAKIGTREQAVTIGRPIANTQLYVLDRAQQPVPIGVPGELYIGGTGVARGYLYRPDLTAERFVPHPFSPDVAARLYRTGDLVRYRPDGTLEFLGRIDQQVKIRGFRIELGEIEAVLAAHPSVREVVVIAREDTSGDKRLVAYMVTSKAALPAPSELRSFLRQQLPEYMVPTAFVELEAFPLTPNGKIDRRALPVPERSRVETDGPPMIPRDALDLQLTQIWEKVLDLKPIGLRENFFELGGHSLMAVRLFDHIERLCGKKLPLATLFQAPTIAQLASILRQEDWVAPWSSLVAIQPGGTKPPFFCIHAHGGDVLFYRDLAEHLGADQPFYALQAQGLDGARPRHMRITDMATHYINEIRTLQFEGPYFLGGFCLGATIALEIAHQLQEQGQDIALLAVIDTYAPGFRATLPQRFVRPYQFMLGAQRFLYHLRNLAVLDTHKRPAYIAIRAQGMKQHLQRRLRRKLHRVTRPGSLKERQSGGQRADASARPMRPAYIPRVLTGRITVFRPSWFPIGRAYDPTMGWENFATDGVDLYEVTGSHQSLIFEPRVRGLAQLLRSSLAEAQTAMHIESSSKTPYT